jgi:hypothetical protein
LWFGPPEAPGNESLGGGEGGVYIQIGGVEQEGVCRRDRGGDATAAVARVTGAHIGENLVLVGVTVAACDLRGAAPGADFEACLDEQLGRRFGADDGTDVATVEDRAPATRGVGGEVALKRQQSLAYRRDRGQARGRLADRLVA